MSEPASKAELESARRDALVRLSVLDLGLWIESKELHARVGPRGRAFGAAMKTLVDGGQVLAVRGPRNVFLYRLHDSMRAGARP